jgi:hypothetical protein
MYGDDPAYAAVAGSDVLHLSENGALGRRPCRLVPKCNAFRFRRSDGGDPHAPRINGGDIQADSVMEKLLIGELRKKPRWVRSRREAGRWPLPASTHEVKGNDRHKEDHANRGKTHPRLA